MHAQQTKVGSVEPIRDILDELSSRPDGGGDAIYEMAESLGYEPLEGDEVEGTMAQILGIPAADLSRRVEIGRDSLGRIEIARGCRFVD